MKNWKIKIKLQLIAFALLSFFSCNFYETEMPIDLPAPKPKLVVHSTFTPFTPPSVKNFAVLVSQNTEVFDTLKVAPIPDATVRLFVDGQLKLFMKYDKISGYMADFFPKAGIEYSISVEKEGFETVTTKGTIPSKVAIKNCELTPFAGLDNDNHAFSRLSVTFADPADQTNYYEIMVLGYGQEKDKYRLTTNDKIITSESYYPSPVLMDADLPKRLLFSDRLINGKSHTVEMTFHANQALIRGKLYMTPNYLFIAFRSVSKDYYLYYTSLLKHSYNRRSDMLFGIAEPSPVYTNIQNGYGLFAGYAEDNRSFWIDSLKVR